MEQKRRETHFLEDILTSAEGVLRVGEKRAVVMTGAAFSLLQQVIHENMPELLIYGFYEVGYRAGRDLAESARQGGESPEDAFRHLVETYRQAGYGDIELLSLDLEKPAAVLRGKDLLESAAASASGIHRSPRAVDHYTRGMFAGLLSELLGKEVICEEVACQFRGDEACVFHVLPYVAGG